MVVQWIFEAKLLQIANVRSLKEFESLVIRSHTVNQALHLSRMSLDLPAELPKHLLVSLR